MVELHCMPQTICLPVLVFLVKVLLVVLAALHQVAVAVAILR